MAPATSGLAGAQDQEADGSHEGARPPVKREYKAIFFEVQAWIGTEADLIYRRWDVFGNPSELFT